MRYRPPQPHDLRKLKQDLSRTGKSMASLFGLAGDHQWRKYTGGSHPREMAPQMLFFGVAQLVLAPEDIERVFARMREIGAEVEPAAPREAGLAYAPVAVGTAGEAEAEAEVESRSEDG